MKSYREKENERKTVRDDCNLQRYLLFLSCQQTFKLIRVAFYPVMAEVAFVVDYSFP